MRLTMDYVAVIEKAADGSYSAYIPHLPGCVSCGDTLEEVRASIGEAVKLHLDSLRRYGEPVPSPSATTHIVHPA